MAKKNKKSDEKQKATAFVNWKIPMSDGSFMRSSKGFPIFQNPDFPHAQEDLLVALAKKHGGSVEITLPCTIVINNSIDVASTPLDDIVISKSAE